MQLVTPWRSCPNAGCRKSFDSVYRYRGVRVFGCRACGHVEPVGAQFGDLTGDGGPPRATGHAERSPARSPAPRFSVRSGRRAA